MERCFAASRISRNGLPSICVSRAPCWMVRSPALTRSVTPYFEICCFAAVHVLIAFDLLFLNGRGLRPLPLIEPLCGGGCQIVTTSPQPTLITGRARNTFECMRPPPNTLLSRCLSPQSGRKNCRDTKRAPLVLLAGWLAVPTRPQRRSRTIGASLHAV